MLFTGWEVRIGLKNGPRPQAEDRFWDRGKIFFYTDRPETLNNIFIFLFHIMVWSWMPKFIYCHVDYNVYLRKEK